MKKPVAVVITDTHQDEDNLPLVLSMHKQAIDLAKSLALDIVVHAGDHFESRISQKLKTLLGFKEVLSLYEKHKVTLVTIPGNHDKTNQHIEESYLDVYDSPNLILFRGECDEHTMNELEIEGVMFHFLPFFSESVYQAKLEYIVENNLEDSEKNVLITHYGIDGALNNDSRKVESAIRENNMKVFDRVLIGHYHNASDVNKKIRYIGSTDPRNFGEDDDKGATIIYSDMSLERYKFLFKSYKKIVVNDLTKFVLKDVIEENKDVNLKIEFIGDKVELAKVNKKEIESFGILVDTKDTSLLNINVESGEVENTIGMEKKDILNYFDEYCKQNSIQKKEVEKISKLF